MITLASGLRVYLACGITDMRKGMTGLAMLVQQTLAEDPFGGAVFAFRGRRAGLIKRCRAVHADQAVGARPVRLALGEHDRADRAVVAAARGAA
jgi:hypothetical protein